MTNVQLNTCEFTLAGEQMFGAKDAEGNYYVAVTEVDACFGNVNTGDFTRWKLASKSLQLALGAVVHPLKLRVGRSTRSFISVETFVGLIEYMAFEEGSTMARALMKATLAESIQRRMDNVLNQRKTEAEYEANTKKAFDDWMQMRESHVLVYEGFMNSGGSPLIADKLMKAYFGVHCEEYKREFERAVDAKANYCPDHSTLVRMREIIDLRRNFTRTSKRHSTTERIRLAVESTQRKHK